MGPKPSNTGGVTTPTLQESAAAPFLSPYEIRISLRKNLISAARVAPLALFLALLFVSAKINISPRQFLCVSVTATGKRIVPEAEGSVVWMTKPRISQLSRQRIAVSRSRGWVRNNGIYISLRDQPAELKIEGYVPRNQVVEFVTSPYSGEAIFVINGSPKKLNLYSRSSGIKTMDLESERVSSGAALFITVLDFLSVLLPPFLVLQFAFLLVYPLYLKFPQLPLRAVANPWLSQKTS
jgi:hypothetical protein